LKQSERNYKRIVIKIGSSLFYSGARELDFGVLNAVAEQSSQLLKDKKEAAIVSSGAIALGMHLLGFKERPRELCELQAAAAIGQNEVVNQYRNAFRGKGIHAAQVLLTREDLNNRKRYLNAKNTLLTLMRLHSLPIINENDTVSTDEIKFGDNDMLSALVAALINADLLIILSDIDGLLDNDKKVIPVVGEITPKIRSLACPTDKKTCVGGMVTKIEAAKICMDSGIPCVIANGRRKDIISSVIKEPEKHGTLFLSCKKLAARERWIAFGTKPKGRIFVDDGAKKALLDKKSLLSVGVTGIEGNFEPGDIVSVTDINGNEFARGKVSISAKHLDNVKGARHDREAVHRNNIVIL
jgi:glutamate 5-kinase